MKASEANLLNILKNAEQFVIPIYQRSYSWTETECRQLWDDILRTGKDDAISAYFIGSIVYIEKGIYHVSHGAPLLVIDGQQRLTTVTLLLAALAKFVGESEPVVGFSAEKLRNYYLLNPLETDERHFKLLLSQTDEETLKSIVKDTPPPKEKSKRISQNFELFERKIASSEDELVAICNGLTKLVVVDIALNREHDDPQLIYESMNATGLKLSQADLIRNYVLMGLEKQQQTDLYKKFWRPMEEASGDRDWFDGFVRGYLTLKTGKIPRIEKVYEAFKKHSSSLKGTDDQVVKLVKDLRDFAEYYCAMTLDKEEDKDLKLAFSDLDDLKAEGVYPFLLELYDDYKKDLLPKEDFVEAVRLTEAYLFRRAICSISSNSQSKFFAAFPKALKETSYLESIKAHFLLARRKLRFPPNVEFECALKEHSYLYNFRKCSYLLHRLENHERKERVLFKDKEYTIEHIMPQKLTAVWKESLGAEWEEIHEKRVGTLGNLTLTGYNSEYSNLPFIKKRDMEGGFRESPLKINADLAKVDTWDETAIKKRSAKLAAQALRIWLGPTLPQETIDKYRPKSHPSTKYTIVDHPHLLQLEVRKIYDAFREEVCALDQCIAEKFLKNYVAYYHVTCRSKQNLIRIKRQGQQIKSLSIALRGELADFNDPHAMCSQVRGAYVLLSLSDIADLQYVIGLVHQSFECMYGDDV